MITIRTAVLLGILGAPQEAPKTDDLRPGLVGEYFHLGPPLETFPTLDAATPPRFKRVDKQIDFLRTHENFGGTRLRDGIFIRWSGLLRVAKAGKIAFSTVSDDGSRLFIDGKQVVDNGGRHEMKEAAGSVALEAGDHEIRVEYFNGIGHSGIRIQWESEGTPKEVIPASALFHKKSASPTEAERKGLHLPLEEARRDGETLSGQLTKVEGTMFTVAVKKDGGAVVEHPIKAEKDLRIQEGERRLSLEDLKPGVPVRVSFRGGVAVRLEVGRRKEGAEEKKETPPVPDGLDERVVSKDEPRPAVWGKVTSVFDDGLQLLLTLRTRGGEVPVYLQKDAKITYVGIDKAVQKPATGLTVHVWLKEGTADQVAEARFSK